MKLAIMTANAITFTFEGLESVTLDPKLCSATINEQARLMGLQARMRDASALSRKQPDGSIITITEAMRRAECLAMRDHLATATEWSARSVKQAPQNPTIAAIAAKLGVTYAEAEAEVARRMMGEMEG
jgi:hypothetical protein